MYYGSCRVEAGLLQHTQVNNLTAGMNMLLATMMSSNDVSFASCLLLL